LTVLLADMPVFMVIEFPILALISTGKLWT